MVQLRRYNARYYDPEVGRFISEDPAGADVSDPKTINRYIYVKNNPLIYTDPSGEIWDLVYAAVSWIADHWFIVSLASGTGAAIDAMTNPANQWHGGNIYEAFWDGFGKGGSLSLLCSLTVWTVEKFSATAVESSGLGFEEAFPESAGIGRGEYGLDYVQSKVMKEIVPPIANEGSMVVFNSTTQMVTFGGQMYPYSDKITNGRWLSDGTYRKHLKFPKGTFQVDYVEFGDLGTSYGTAKIKFNMSGSGFSSSYAAHGGRAPELYSLRTDYILRKTYGCFRMHNVNVNNLGHAIMRYYDAYGEMPWMKHI